MTNAAARPEVAHVDVDSYVTGSVRKRLEACFLDHVGRIVTREVLAQVAGGAENWHQRLSELRTDVGYTIETSRDRPGVLRPGEYVLVSTAKSPKAGRRVVPTATTWAAVLAAAGHACQWDNDGQVCGLQDGERDPVGGGTVRLTADHNAPHSIKADADPSDPSAWGALCGRHQVMKKNFWDSTTGKVNIIALLQAASVTEKRAALAWLRQALGEDCGAAAV